MVSHNKSPVFFKNLSPNVEEINFSNQISLRSYSVPMDFDGIKILYTYKSIDTKEDTKNDFAVLLYDFKNNLSHEIKSLPYNIKLLKLFKKGFVYVFKNKRVCYFDIEAQKETFLYNHSVTVVNICTDGRRIATIDKKNQINILDFETGKFIINDISLRDTENLTDELKKIRTFEMEYPYFSCVNESLYCFTTDFGVFVVNYNN